jgi:predicted patatin/cPLA2 family phospholipase
MKKALVVSGGGSKGAFSGGIIENLIKLKNKDWDIYVASSTGSLIIPSTSIGDIDKLKQQYTSVDNKSIFKISPFTQKGKVRILNAVWRVLTGKDSIGDGSRLRKRIEKIFTEENFNESIKRNKEIYVCVSNLTTAKAEFKLQKDCNYKDFCDWMYASCSVPVGFEVVKKDGYDYVDGGLIHTIPIQKAIDAGAEEIDIIILKEKNPNYEDGWEAKNVFNVFMRIIDVMNIEISRDDILVGSLSGEQKEITMNFYYTPYKLTKNSIIFNKEDMLKWWELGYNFDKINKELLKTTNVDLKENNLIHSIKIKKNLKTNKYNIQ